MQLGNRILRILVRGHFDEGKAARAARLAVAHHIDAGNVAGFREQRGEVVLVGVIREIADIEFVAHSALCASDRCSMGNAALGAGCSGLAGAGECVR